MKADGEEEGFGRIALLQPSDGGRREGAVYEVVVGPGGLGPGKSLPLSGLYLHVARSGRRERPFVLERRSEVPRLRIVHALEARGDAKVEDFAAPSRRVAVL